MAVRKVLLLTYHFPPSGAVAVYRMLGLVRYLPRFGWQPVVVAPPELPGEPQDPSLLNLVPEETPVERVPLARGPLGPFVRRFAPEAHWLAKAMPACRRMIREHSPDAVITSSPPGQVHLLGMWLKASYGLPWIACFRDPWVTNGGAPGWSMARWIRDRMIETQVMKRATMLVANTPLNLAGWQAAFPEQADKMVMIHNGFDPEVSPTFARNEGVRDRLTILYAGELYNGRDPRPLLQAMQELENGPAEGRLPVQLQFLGRNTEQLFDFPAEIRSRGLEDRVQLHGHLAHGAALERMSAADILLLVHPPGQRIGVQAKLYEYLAMGRPILALVEEDSDMAWVLRESRVHHRVAPPGDVAKIKQALTELTQEVRAGVSSGPDTAALEQFTRQRMAQRFAECLERSTAQTLSARLATCEV